MITTKLCRILGYRQERLSKLSKNEFIIHSPTWGVIEFNTIISNFSNGADRDRTDDLRRAKPALSQLSYSPIDKLVGLSGFEPLTSRLSGVRSNQLSYRPVPGVKQHSKHPESAFTSRTSLIIIKKSRANPPSILIVLLERR